MTRLVVWRASGRGLASLLLLGGVAISATDSMHAASWKNSAGLDCQYQFNSGQVGRLELTHQSGQGPFGTFSGVLRFAYVADDGTREPIQATSSVTLMISPATQSGTASAAGNCSASFETQESRRSHGNYFAGVSQFHGWYSVYWHGNLNVYLSSSTVSGETLTLTCSAVVRPPSPPPVWQPPRVPPPPRQIPSNPSPPARLHPISCVHFLSRPDTFYGVHCEAYYVENECKATVIVEVRKTTQGEGVYLPMNEDYEVILTEGGKEKLGCVRHDVTTRIDYRVMGVRYQRR